LSNDAKDKHKKLYTIKLNVKTKEMKKKNISKNQGLLTKK